MNKALQGIAGPSSPKSTPSIHEFLKSTTPEKAKAELERMASEGKVDRSQLEGLVRQAKALARDLGLK